MHIASAPQKVMQELKKESLKGPNLLMREPLLWNNWKGQNTKRKAWAEVDQEVMRILKKRYR